MGKFNTGNIYFAGDSIKVYLIILLNLNSSFSYIMVLIRITG